MTSRWNRARGGGAPSPICFLADKGPENSKSARLYTRRHDGEEPFGERYRPISSLRRLDGGRSSATRRAGLPSPPVLCKNSYATNWRELRDLELSICANLRQSMTICAQTL